MNDSLQNVITRTEVVLAALRRLSEMPQVAPFKFIGDDLSVGMIQLFPCGMKTPTGHREVARNLARVLGGKWTVDADKWETDQPTFAGLEGSKIVLHYIEPVKIHEEVDLNDPSPVSAAAPAATQQEEEVTL